MTIGIDFSINSTAMCIKKGESIHFFSFVPNYKPGYSAFKAHELLEPDLTIISYKKDNTIKDPIRDQEIKLENANRLSQVIIEEIKKLKTHPTEIRIEGFSYASKGNSFIDLIMFNSFLKLKIIQEWGMIIKVIPPKTLKKAYTGNGNANKVDMIKEFILDSNINPPVRNKIKDLLSLPDEEVTRIPKPIDDLADSAALVRLDLLSP